MHRVLCRDMPAKDRQTQAAIRQLPRTYGDVITARYGLFRDDDGRVMTNQAKADLLEITLDLYKYRLKAARRALKALLGL